MTFYYVPDVARALLSVESFSLRGHQWMGHPLYASMDGFTHGLVLGTPTCSGST